MTIVHGYLTLDQLQSTLKASPLVVASVADYELAISAASRWIDARCSDSKNGRIRHFWRDATPTARLYRAESIHLVCTSDFTSLTDTTVEINTTGSTWTPLASGLWQPEPLVRLDGHPYTTITTTTYPTTFPMDLRPRVRVTARWGWESVPEPVSQACQILAVAYMLGKDVISNEDGYSIGARGAADPITLAEHLLGNYMPETDPAVMASAIALATAQNRRYG